jgi:hypothetical protein
MMRTAIVYRLCSLYLIYVIVENEEQFFAGNSQDQKRRYMEVYKINLGDSL